MNVSIRTVGWTCLWLALLTAALPRPAAADTITIGHVTFGPFNTWVEDPFRGYVPWLGAIAYVRNESPVTFEGVVLEVSYSTLGVSYDWSCQNLVVAPEALQTCETGPIQYVPGTLAGIGWGGSLAGTLASTSWLLPDGSTFQAYSSSFSVGPVFDLNTVDRSIGNLIRPILIDGDVIPPSTASVPEPGPFSLLLSGVLIFAWRARRR